jgi:type I restriction enzyme S subunit
MQVELSKLFYSSYELSQKLIEFSESLKKLKQSQLKFSFARERCEKIKISDVSESLDSRRIPIKKSERIKGDYPYYGASGIVDSVREYIFDEPILLVSEDGENLNSRKLPIAYEVDHKCWVNNHAHVLKITKGCRYLIAEYLNFHDISDFISGGTRPKITKGMLDDMPIYQPKQDLVEKVKSQLQMIDKAIYDAEEKNRLNSSLLKVLQNQVF